MFEVPTAAYIHIPFCRRRCFYCDFPISVVGDKPPVGNSFGSIAEYVEFLCREIASREIVSAPSDSSGLAPAPLDTVFFGGGTPSLLAPAQLGQILTTLDRQVSIAATAEISMEIDPGTFDLAHLQGYCAAGINRVSLGVQSFEAEILQACGRTHRPEDIAAAVDLIQRVGLKNFSLDLISGLPHLTLERWQNALEQAIALAPTHLSIYDLTLEPRTAFDRWYQPGIAPLPSEDDTAQMYRLAQQILTTAGYHHYEISNYARPGYQCRHNRVYWENRPYYGFGMAAASYINQGRWTRPRTRQEYFAWVESGAEINQDQTREIDRLLDTFMLGLRLAEGLKIETLRLKFGDPLLQKVLDLLQPYIETGWVEPIHPSSQSIRLTDPEGFLFSNVVLSSLFEKLE